jgi:exopolysaccharide biosynthesis polyprenyl glycosylphosphotransferase
MHFLRRRIVLSALKLSHLGIVLFSFALAAVPAWHENQAVTFSEFLSMRVKIGNFFVFFGLLLCWHVLFSLCGLYVSHRLSSRTADVVDVLKATSLAVLALWCAAFSVGIQMATPRFLLVFWISSTFMLICVRLVLRAVLVQTRLRGRNLRDMLIVGTNARAIEFAEGIGAKPELGYRIVGFADQQWPGMNQFSEAGYSVACGLDGLSEFFRKNVVDEVVVALPLRSFHAEASRIAAICEEQGILLRVLSNIFDVTRARARAEEMEGGDSLITHYTGISEGWPLVVKRLLDVSLALAILVVVSPIMLVATLLIKLTSPGPVFFRQKRVGHGKRSFTIYKFRTMIVDAESRMRLLEHLNEVSGPVFKIKDDPRITRVGNLLRKTSIDELPQLINVLKGDMSLVGPRPLPVRDYEGFQKDWHLRRFTVRPGITCLWQVSGRSSLPFERWMELDVQYIDQWSLWLDLQILAKTIPAVLKGAGAA